VQAPVAQLPDGDSAADASRGMLREMFLVAVLLHTMMLLTSVLGGRRLDALVGSEGVLCGVAVVGSLRLRRPMSARGLLWLVRLVIAACLFRWTTAWWGTDAVHLYTTIVSVGLYIPLLMITTAPLRKPWTFWGVPGVALAGIASAAILQPHLEGSVFADLRLAPSLFLAMLLGLRYIARWERHLRHIEAVEVRASALSEAARTDPLTGLLNRMGLEDVMAGVRAGGGTWAVLLVDVDHFKRVNDENGHRVGDLVLQEIAAELKRRVRSSDAVARWGGEEFLVLLRDIGSDAAMRVAEQIRAGIEERRNPEGHPPVTVSIGVALGEGDEDGEAVIHAADEALYAAKRAGRNQVQAAVHAG